MLFRSLCKKENSSTRKTSCFSDTRITSRKESERWIMIKVKYYACNSKLVLYRSISLFFKAAFVLFLWDLSLLRIASRGSFLLKVKFLVFVLKTWSSRFSKISNFHQYFNIFLSNIVPKQVKK